MRLDCAEHASPARACEGGRGFGLPPPVTANRLARATSVPHLNGLPPEAKFGQDLIPALAAVLLTADKFKKSTFLSVGCLILM
jgi:hypothetical protein